MFNSEYRIWSEDYQDYTPTFVVAQDGTILDPNNLTFMDVIGHVGKDFKVEYNLHQQDSMGHDMYDGDLVKSNGGDLYRVKFDKDKLVYKIGQFTFDSPKLEFIKPYNIVGNIHQGCINKNN